MEERLEKLRSLLQTNALDAILVSQAENRRYLSGFIGSAGYLLISPERAILAVDFRYVEQAHSQAPEFEVVKTEAELVHWFPRLALDLGARTIGFEGDDLPFASYKRLTEAVAEAGGELNLLPTQGVVESLRAIKDAEELEKVEKAAALVNSAIEEVALCFKPGITEREAAWEVEKFLRHSGSEAVPFDLIVASGPNAALPHARPSERRLEAGGPVVIDIGARVGGYCSDLTRTLCLGEADSTFNRVYDVVLGAQLAALALIEPGMTGEQADRLARTVIEEAGYKDAFGHGLGHGVGLAEHEGPRLGPGSTDVLAEGMVFTLEPGIYLSGWGGVRIEDMVVLERGKARVLTKASKVLGREA